jgi:1-pyrroline-5-carboxylate dehydrogenase
MNGETFISVSDTKESETTEFIASLNACTKSGLHNPLKNPQRYIEYGNISARAAAKMREPEVMEFFTRLIQRVAPKSHAQVLAKFFIFPVDFQISVQSILSYEL